MIDASEQKNRLNSDIAELASFQAALVGKQALLHKAMLDFKRQQTMLKADATSRENFDAAKTSLDVAEAELTQAQMQIRQSKIKVDTTRLNLSRTQVTAPIDGVVVSLAVEEGQTVSAVQQTPPY